MTAELANLALLEARIFALNAEAKSTPRRKPGFGYTGGEPDKHYAELHRRINHLLTARQTALASLPESEAA